MGARRAARAGAASVALCVAVLGAGGSSAGAPTLYRYVDEQGRVHYADDPSKLPVPGRAEPVASLPASPGADVAGGAAAGAAPATGAARGAGRTASPRPVGKRTCRFLFSGRQRAYEGRNVLYRGEVRNVGTGEAQGVVVQLADLDAAGREIGTVEVRVVPGTLGPGEVGRFQITMRLGERAETRADASFGRSRFSAVAARCL